MLSVHKPPTTAPQLSWFLGLLIVVGVVTLSTVLPLVMLLLAGASLQGMFSAAPGSVLIAWFALIAVFRAGQRRGWWR